MIVLNRRDKAPVYVDALSIVSIRTAGTSSQWHGICCYVKTIDGVEHECSEAADVVVERIDEYISSRESSVAPLQIFAAIAVGVEAGYHRWVMQALEATMSGSTVPEPFRDVAASS
jgi:hypothetical protein